MTASGPAAPFREGDKRRYGYSRDRRSDCVQLLIALVVTRTALLDVAELQRAIMGVYRRCVWLPTFAPPGRA